MDVGGVATYAPSLGVEWEVVDLMGSFGFFDHLERLMTTCSVEMLDYFVIRTIEASEHER